MKTLIKFFGVICILVIGYFIFFSATNEYPAFQRKMSALAKHIIKHRSENRMASYYQWVREVDAEWQQVKQKLNENPMAGDIIKKQDEVLDNLLKKTEEDKANAPADVPQIQPEN
jgi:hypothetical protein